jgi:hypothetical protein
LGSPSHLRWAAFLLAAVVALEAGVVGVAGAVEARLPTRELHPEPAQ